jgi:adenosine deaminase
MGASSASSAGATPPESWRYDDSMPKPHSPPHATADTLDVAAAQARSLPKVLLHEHLDGGLRVPTLHALLRAKGLPSPADDPQSLARWFDAHAHAGSLEQYLAGFALTVSAMANLAAMEQVAFEAAEDALADGCVLAEFRIAPLLFEAHGVAPDAAVEALLAGLRRSRLASGLIVCAMREQPPASSVRAARLALRYRDQGVIGFDLAGPELGYPPRLHAEALKLVRDAGLGITLHAGEADGAQRVLEAVEHGATRIGHGVRLAEALAPGGDRELFDRVLQHGVHLEVCPSSNVHTGAYPSLATHPIARLWRAGVSLSFHTDNRLMSATTMAAEAEALVRECGLAPADLAAMTLAAAAGSFLPAADRARARDAVLAWAAAEGVVPTAR